MELRHWKQNVEGEKCPVCRMINTNFYVLESGLLGCRSCGCVFISRGVRHNAQKIDVINRPSHEIIEEEVNAQKVRKDERQVQKEGNERQGGEEESGQDIQLSEKEGPEAGNEKEIKCERCGMICKSLAGLRAHQRRCG